MALPQPKGKQLEVLDLKPEGHNVVLGTAGSGKTTLAIYRAIYLATLDDKEKVMLVTFNTTLVKYLEAIVGSEIPRNIEVRNYHKFARGYLAHRNKMPRWNGIVSGMEDGDNKKQLFVRRALENVKAVNGTNSTLKRAEEVFLEEINWIEKMGIKTLDEYEKVERVGRFDTRIIRENRKYFFQVYKAYLEVRKEEGYLYDWEDIAQTVCEELENDTEKRMYKHIIVDEPVQKMGHVHITVTPVIKILRKSSPKHHITMYMERSMPMARARVSAPTVRIRSTSLRQPHSIFIGAIVPPPQVPIILSCRPATQSAPPFMHGRKISTAIAIIRSSVLNPRIRLSFPRLVSYPIRPT